MDRCPDVEELTRQIYAAMAAGDVEAVSELISTADGVTWIGTDPAEWWLGRDSVLKVFASQFEAMGGMQLVDADPVGYRDGDVGWVADQPTVQLPDGTRIPMRITAVARRDRDGWRFVQCHASVGLANVETVGVSLPTSA